MELKPCPFCGEKADHYIRVARGTAQDYIRLVIYCAKCGIEIQEDIQSGSPMYRFEESNQLLIERWNRRAENES